MSGNFASPVGKTEDPEDVQAKALHEHLGNSLGEIRAAMEQLETLSTDLHEAILMTATLLGGDSIGLKGPQKCPVEEVHKTTISASDGRLGAIHQELQEHTENIIHYTALLEHARDVVNRCTLALGGPPENMIEKGTYKP